MISVIVVVSVLCSVITTKVLADHYFKIVERHVNEMIKMTNQFVEAVMRKYE